MANHSKIGSLLDPNLFGKPQTLQQVATGSGAGSGSSEVLVGLTQQLQQLQTVSQAETESLTQNTQAVAQNTSLLGQSGQGTAGKTASTIESTLGLGLGLSPLITGLISLFGGGGGGSQQTAPVRFALPPAVNVNAGVSEAAPTQAFGIDYAAGGQPRGASSGSGAQITVQVQAMDSQSFLDHSHDIARAVRQAMLETSVLNDVIREI
jgi:hypothetical protein